MKTAHLGRRLGDWLGIVPEDEITWSTPADLFDLDEFADTSARVETTYAPASEAAVFAPPTPMPPPVPHAAPVTPAPSPDRSQGPFPEPAKTALTFREVVNQRRAAMQQRAANPQAPTRW